MKYVLVIFAFLNGSPSDVEPFVSTNKFNTFDACEERKEQFKVDHTKYMGTAYILRCAPDVNGE